MNAPRFSTLILVGLLVFLPQVAWSVPANQDALRLLAQPDGSRFSARLIGDEWVHWYETADSFTIVQDASGYWTYAALAADGSLASTSEVVGQDRPGEEPGLRPEGASVDQRHPRSRRHLDRIHRHTGWGRIHGAAHTFLLR
jgi:hypothetical protein